MFKDNWEWIKLATYNSSTVLTRNLQNPRDYAPLRSAFFTYFFLYSTSGQIPTRISRDAKNECAVTKGGTVLKGIIIFLTMKKCHLQLMRLFWHLQFVNGLLVHEVHAGRKEKRCFW